jgi:transketolase
MIHNAKSGHPGGSLSSVEILLTLYFYIMKTNLDDPDRDYFILSKGHSAPLLYTVLMEAGYIPKTLNQLRKLGGVLQGHPDALKTRGVELSSGSLGNGLSVAAGVAASIKLDKRKSRVYCLLGDGECDEGLIWEGAMMASSKKLDNLTAIVDRNMFQIDGLTENVVCLEPFPDKWKAFNWNVLECNGHNFEELIKAFNEVAKYPNQPTVIIANTVKGKGVSFMENNAGFHGRAPNDKELTQALKELGGSSNVV